MYKHIAEIGDLKTKLNNGIKIYWQSTRYEIKRTGLNDYTFSGGSLFDSNGQITVKIEDLFFEDYFFSDPHESEFIERPYNNDIAVFIRLFNDNQTHFNDKINNLTDLIRIAKSEHRFDIANRVNRFLGV